MKSSHCSCWDVNGKMEALHSLNELRVPFIRDCLLYQGHGSAKTRKPLENVSVGFDFNKSILVFAKFNTIYRNKYLYYNTKQPLI